MERDTHPYNPVVKMIVSVLEKADLVERKYTKLANIFLTY